MQCFWMQDLQLWLVPVGCILQFWKVCLQLYAHTLSMPELYTLYSHLSRSLCENKSTIRPRTLFNVTLGLDVLQIETVYLCLVTCLIISRTGVAKKGGHPFVSSSVHFLSIP